MHTDTYRHTHTVLNNFTDGRADVSCGLSNRFGFLHDLVFKVWGKCGMWKTVSVSQNVTNVKLVIERNLLYHKQFSVDAIIQNK